MFSRWTGLILLLMSCAAVNAQTDSLNILWSPNSDPDIFRYVIERSVSTNSAFSPYQYIFHPDTHFVERNISPGNMYYYRMAAIDSAANQSGYSPELSAGLPDISLQLSALITGSDSVWALSSIINDPDEALANLQITISGQSNISVTADATNLTIAPVPIDYLGPASFTLRVEDSDGFYDQVAYSINYVEESVFEVNIPDVTFNEDGSTTLQLDSYVIINNYLPSQLTWSFSDAPDLDEIYNAGARSLTLQSSLVNWNGQNSLTATATAPDQSTAQATFTVTIDPVNDPPVASVNSIIIESDPQLNVIDLKPFASDPDHAVTQLSWTFSGYSDFSFDWVDQANQLVRITPLNSSFEEQGSFRLTDPNGLEDQVNVTIRVRNIMTINTPNLVMDEGGNVAQFVNDLATSTNYSSDSLSWTFSPGVNLRADYNSSTRIINVYANDSNWNGVDQVIAEATAPDLVSVRDTFQVTINSINDPPLTTLSYLAISNDTNGVVVDLDPYLSDPDHANSQLLWEINGFTHFEFYWVSKLNQELRITPLGTAAADTGVFIVRDPLGASDVANVIIEVTDFPQTVLTVNIPDQRYNEDQSTTVFVDTATVVSPYAPNELVWAFVTGNRLSVDFNAGTRRATISSVGSHWSGSEDIVAFATTPNQVTVSDTFNVVVDPVNDPPFISLTALNLSPDPELNVFDLKQYSNDVDNSDLELNWSFGGYLDFDFVWVDQAQKIIKIVPQLPNATENGTFTVTDPAGSSYQAAVQLTVSANPNPSFSVDLGAPVFDEDTNFRIDLDTTVTISNYTVDQLNWSFTSGQNVLATYTAANRSVLLQARSINWFGSEDLVASATAPDFSVYHDTFTVTITPVNDPPVAGLSVLQVTADPDSNLKDLKPFSSDPDHGVSQLTWNFWGFDHFGLVWENLPAKLLRVTPLDTVLSETGFFSLTDPTGAADTVSVEIRVTDNPTTVFVVNIPNRDFLEDKTDRIQMDSVVVIEGTAVSQLTWSFVPGLNLRYTYSEINREVVVQSKVPDWNGVDILIATATAPDQRTSSDTVQVVIRPVNDPPGISTPILYVDPPPDTTFYDLDDYAIDVDNSSSQLNWTFWGFSNFLVQWEDEANRVIRIKPLNTVTIESGFFSVSDPFGAADTVAMTLEIDAGSSVFLVDIPTMRFDEDTHFDLQMDTVVTVGGISPNQLTWTFAAGPELDFSYNNATRKLSIESADPDWFGQDWMAAIATAPDQRTRVDTFLVNIDPVNDAPNSQLTTLFVSPFSSNIFDLKLYGYDVDDTAADLDWDFWGYTRFDIEWEDRANRIIHVSPRLNAETESGFFRVFDPSGAGDTSSVAITFIVNNTAPHIRIFNAVSVIEDSSTILNLVNLVIDSTNGIGELSFDITPGPNLMTEFDSSLYRLKLIPSQDWDGWTSFNLVVSDPFGLQAEKEVLVFVERRNDLLTLQLDITSNENASVNIETEIPSTVDFSYWQTTDQIITLRSTNFRQQHTLSLVGLLADTRYFYSVEIIDQDGLMLQVNDSSFTTAGPVVQELGDFLVYPNPIKPSAGHRDMIFLNLPVAAREILLYSILGEKLHQVKLAAGQRQYRLPVVDNGNLRLSSGMYIYLVKDDRARVINRGKVVYIR